MYESQDPLHQAAVGMVRAGVWDLGTESYPCFREEGDYGV